MQNKKIWDHLCKELGKTNTLMETSQKILKSPLFLNLRYKVFSIAILDSFTRVIILSIYQFFDRKYSFCLDNLLDLKDEEKKEIINLKLQAKDYIIIRQNKIGHLSKKVKLEEFNRFNWLENNELEKIKDLLIKIGKFLNTYGKKRFKEKYNYQYSNVGITLQCLIEDLKKL